MTLSITEQGKYVGGKQNISFKTGILKLIVMSLVIYAVCSSLKFNLSIVSAKNKRFA